MADTITVYGSDASYYTGKLEAYFRAKGIDYRLVPFTPSNIRRAAANTGVVQIPQVECPDGTWLVDTTPILAYFERTRPEPAITPHEPAVAFVSLLLEEDWADEWLWRPAMHYRWSYPMSARLMSAWLGEHLGEAPGPALLKRWYFRARQTLFFVRFDGVTSATRAAVEASYLDTLTALESIFQTRPFVLGERPTEADFGLFASMFRHFFSDPTPARILRERAPGVQEWVARMWNLRPERIADRPMPERIAEDLAPLFDAVSTVYLPYLAANERALAAGDAKVRYRVQDVGWVEPTKPYRVTCLAELRRAWQGLDPTARATVAAALANRGAVEILDADPAVEAPVVVPSLPIAAGGGRRPVDSWWRGG